MRRLTAGITAPLAATAALVVLTGRAHAADPPVGCNPYVDPTCTVHVVNPGPPGSTGSPAPVGGGPAPGCSWKGVSYPCTLPIYGSFSNSDGCYWRLWQPQPPAGDPAWQGHAPGDGGVYVSQCEPGLTPGGNAWFATAPVATVSPDQLAQQALKTLTLPHPTTGMSPDGRLKDGRPYTVVKAFTWFWSDPSTYKTLTARAAAGAVWAQVTVTPTALTFKPGDGGNTASCPGPGRAWVTGKDSQWASAPGGCDYAYRRSTYGYPNGELTATYGITWTVTWTGSGGANGTLPEITTTTNSTFAVAEAQAVIVR